MSIVNMGSKAFAKQNAGFGDKNNTCNYRICQDYVFSMIEYMDKYIY